MMRCQYLSNKFKSIEDTLRKAINVSGNDPELSSMLSSYLVVFISGIYEDVIEHLFVQRAGKNKDKEIESLVKLLIDRQFRNPEYEKIKELVKALGAKHETALSKIDSKSKDGLNSIVTNKNYVAHGKVSSATLNDVTIFHDNALKIFEALENILL